MEDKLLVDPGRFTGTGKGKGCIEGLQTGSKPMRCLPREMLPENSPLSFFNCGLPVVELNAWFHPNTVETKDFVPQATILQGLTLHDDNLRWDNAVTSMDLHWPILTITFTSPLDGTVESHFIYTNSTITMFSVNRV